MAMCRYLVADGRHCTEEAGDHDLCRWHDPAAAHNTPDTAEALERYVRQGGLCHGLQLARAELADADALAAALESGKVASYVTDFPTEAVLAMKNAVVIPHLGASTPESEENCARMAAQELREYLENGQIRNSVNLPEILLGRSEGIRIQIIHGNEPGMVSAISAAIGARKININNRVNKSRKDVAVTVLEVEKAPDARLLPELMALPNVIRVRTF